MAFEKGNKLAAGGVWKEKPFREALRMEIAAAGPDMKALRRVAVALLDKAYEGDMAAVKEVADRLDGKPAQESTVTLENKRDLTQWTRAELVAFLDQRRLGGNGAHTPDRRGGEPDRVH